MTRRIVLAGASGLIGRELAAALRHRGDEVHLLVRGEVQGQYEHSWNPSIGEVDATVLSDRVLSGADALISLNGASVGHLPWTKSYKSQLLASRLNSTRALARAVRQLGAGAPKAWLSASAVGYYGDRPGEDLSEASSAGDSFLARLCVEWEAAARVTESSTRVVLLRTAPVLHPQGVLKPMITLTKLGLGGPLGSGQQVWPWISLTDEVRGIVHALDRGLSGPINLTGPSLATANEIGRELAAELRRPFLMPAPGFALKLALGKDASESLLLADAAVRPDALLSSGFEFEHPTPAEAIRASLG
ncbi:MAG: TIGR01777 family oxidoreductase [Actinobacteria bacterium]|nr:TIGR01777 family oxidoreductase [Actinomycetota bacterium]